MLFKRGVIHGMLVLSFIWWLSDRGFESTLTFCGCLLAVMDDASRSFAHKKITLKERDVKYLHVFSHVPNNSPSKNFLSTYHPSYLKKTFY
jgi:hypothetical protein